MSLVKTFFRTIFISFIVRKNTNNLFAKTQRIKIRKNHIFIHMKSYINGSKTYNFCL